MRTSTELPPCVSRSAWWPRQRSPKALPKCNIVYRNGEEMKKDISAYLQVLYDASPASVGGKLPDDGFYYTEPSVLRKVMAAIRNSASKFCNKNCRTAVRQFFHVIRRGRHRCR